MQGCRVSCVSAQGGNKTLVYCPELGLAIEQLKEGMTIEQLWNVL